MIEVKGDLFTYNPGEGNILRCFTSCGVLKKNKELVMGAGCALAAKQRFPTLPHLLGARLMSFGHQVHVIKELKIAAFPTKHHFRNPSCPILIKKSCQQLKLLSDDYDFVIIPRPGCNLGGLSWEKQVKPIVSEELKDNKFIIISRD